MTELVVRVCYGDERSSLPSQLEFNLDHNTKVVYTIDRHEAAYFRQDNAHDAAERFIASFLQRFRYPLDDLQKLKHMIGEGIKSTTNAFDLLRLSQDVNGLISHIETSIPSVQNYKIKTIRWTPELEHRSNLRNFRW